MKVMEIEKFRLFLVELAEEIRSKPIAPYFDGALMVIGKQIKFLYEAEQKGEKPNMDKLKKEITVSLGTMADIPARTREGYWPGKIKEEAERLEQALKQWRSKNGKPEAKPTVLFSAEDIKAAQLANVLKRLQTIGEVSPGLKVIQRGQTVCLIEP